MIKTNLDSLLLDLTNIVLHNHDGRSYKIWEKPILQENIDWFTKKGKERNFSLKIAAHNDKLLAERLEEMIDLGLNLKDKAYIIANVNSPLFFKKALDNGADPNINVNNQLLIDFVISKGMNAISKIIIDNDNFNWNFNKEKYPNLLFKCVVYNKFELANFIAHKKPEFILRKSDEPSIAYMVADFLENNNNNIQGKDKILNFVEYCCNYAINQNYPFDTNETHNNTTLLESSFEVASIIKKVESESLKRSLHENCNKYIKKAKI